jgi:dTDP-4-amino-4,6-dideoxygalactose transaminase
MESKKSIQVTRPSLPPMDEYFAEIRDIWDSRWLTNSGSKHERLEKELKEFLGAEELVLFSNGHLALEAAVSAFGLQGEVITTPFTFASTTHAIVRCGLTPVFCDIAPEDYTMDPGKIEELITEKTTAILPVHVYGNVCHAAEIQAIADRYGLKVVYDAAHAFGENLDGKSVATFGDASMFSFHATKVFHTIEGGAVAFRGKALRERLGALKNFGMDDGGDVVLAGGNAKMNEFQAAMGLCNLRHLPEEIEKRRVVSEIYDRLLTDVSGIRIPAAQPGVSRNYAYYPVLFEGGEASRDAAFAHLREERIFARKYFYPLTSDFPCYRGHCRSGPLETAEAVAPRVLTLPLYAGMEAGDAERVCEVLRFL